MRKMKDSGIEWIGEIPEHWNCSKAKYYIQISNGSDPKTDGDIPVYGSGSGCFKTCGESKDGPAVLLGRKGTVDIPRYIEEKYWNVDTAFDVKTDETSLLLKYYFYLSTCFDYRFYTATTTLPSMTQTSYENMFIPVPDIDMQHKIVAYIESKCKELDMIITAKEKTNELLKERRQSIIYAAVTKGLDPTVPMKDSGIEWIGEIPESWSVWRLKHLLCQEKGAIKAGPFGSSITANDMQGGDVKVFTQRTVLDNDFLSGDEYISFDKYEDLKGFSVKTGDILITTRGTIGKTAIVPKNSFGILHPCLIKMSIDSDKINKSLLCRIFNETNIFEEQLRLASNATTIDVIYTQNLLNIFVPLAPLHEQDRICKYLNEKCESLDYLISSNDSTIEKLKEYRQSVIYEAVTGKVEI